MTKSLLASLTAIVRQLQGDYFPTSAEPLPAELGSLVAQLVAIESGKQMVNVRPVEILHSK
jgi:hypothetical protein